MLVIGSQAMKAHEIDRDYSKTKDFDVIGEYYELQETLEELQKLGIKHRVDYKESGDKVIIFMDNTIVEWEIAWEDSTGKELIDICKDDESPRMTMGPVASLEALLALKLSHRYKKNSPHFLKTMRDIMILRDHVQLENPAIVEWMKKRQKETLNYGHPSLNKNKEGFFANDGIDYVYDHDQIHQIMAHRDQPAFKAFQDPMDDVKVSKELWLELPEAIKQEAVLEEAYVLALERSQIPRDFKPKPYDSYLKAVEKICTSITSGWFREYAWENYNAINARYDDFYVCRFTKAVKDGRIHKQKAA